MNVDFISKQKITTDILHLLNNPDMTCYASSLMQLNYVIILYYNSVRREVSTFVNINNNRQVDGIIMYVVSSGEGVCVPVR